MNSRSAPLAIALQRHPKIRVLVHIDERSGSFFGVGLAKGTGKPVVLLCTSGTAAAEFHPAVVEAFHSRTPLIVDLKPGGRFVATDLYAAGGVRLIAQRLLDGGLLHGDTPTVTGRTLAEEASRAREAERQEVVRPIDSPLKATGGLAILRGNLAPDGCVVKLAGHERLSGTQWTVIGVYVVYLLPYIVVCYYERYAIPLLGVKVLLVLWGADRLLSMVQRLSSAKHLDYNRDASPVSDKKCTVAW